MNRSAKAGVAVGLVALAGGLIYVLSSGAGDVGELRVVDEQTIEPGQRIEIPPEQATDPKQPETTTPEGSSDPAKPDDEPAPTATPAGGAVAAGRVIDTYGTPIAGASVYLLKMPEGNQVLYGADFGAESRYGSGRGTTDALGRYEIEAGPGSYTLGADAEGFGRVHLPVHLVAGELRADLVLRTGGAIEGRVTDSNGNPLSGASVDAFGGFDVKVGPGGDTTDEAGRYRIRSLTPANYFMVARAPGYVPAYQGNVRENRRGVDFKLEAAPKVSVRVLTKGTGEGIPGASLSVRYPRDQEGGWLRSNLIETAADPGGEPGAYVLTNVSPGVFNLTVSASGYATRTLESLNIGVGESRELKVELSAGGALEGKVLASDGTPIPGALIVRFRERAGLLSLLTVATERDLLDGVTDGEQARSDGTGSYSLPRVEPGEQTLVAFKSGFGAARVKALVQEAQTARAPDLVLEPAGRLEGNVRRADGEPVAGLIVVATGPGGVRTVPLDAKATFAVDGLGAGSYMLSVNQGHQPLAATRVDLGPGEWKRLTLEVHTGATVEGVVGVPPGQTAASVQLLKRDGGLGNLEGRVGEGSRYAISGVPPGTYSALVDGVRVRDGIEIPRTGTFQLDLELPAGTIAGRAVAASDQSPLAQARALLWLGEGEQPTGEEGVTAGFVAAVEAGADGSFELSGLDGKSYRLVLMKQGFAPVEVPVELKAGGRVDVGAVALEAGKTLSGVVVDGEGSPVAGAQIYATHPTTGNLATSTPFAAISGADGTFVVESLAPVELDLSAFQQGRAPGSARVTPGSDGGVTLTLGAPCSLELQLTQAGEPAAGASVSLVHGEGRVLQAPLLVHPLQVSGTTGVGGAFHVSELPPGPYTVSFARQGTTGSVQVVLQAGPNVAQAALE